MSSRGYDSKPVRAVSDELSTLFSPLPQTRPPVEHLPNQGPDSQEDQGAPVKSARDGSSTSATNLPRKRAASAPSRIL